MSVWSPSYPVHYPVPEMHCSQGSWLAQWSRNQQVPLRPLTSYQVNQLHSGLPPHMSWHWPTVTSCTMSRLLSSVMSHVPAVNIPHSSANVVEVEGSEFCKRVLFLLI